MTEPEHATPRDADGVPRDADAVPRDADAGARGEADRFAKRETARASIDQLPFDEALAELQRTVAELEAGGQPLETAIALYERGVALHERCAALLSDAELRVRRLVERAGGALQAVEVRTEDVEASQ